MLKLIDGTELTEEIKEAFKKSTTSAYIKLNDGTILSSSNYLKEIKLEDFRYNEETGNIIGEAISKRLSLSLFNQENALNIENKEFELIIGTKLSLNEENNFYDINDVLLMSKDMTINDDDTVTATFDNTNGTEAQYLNLFTNVSGFLGTSEKYFAVLEVINVTGTGAITVTDSSVELEHFENLQDTKLLKYKIKTLDNFLKSNTVLKSYVKFNPGESGSITFRISIFQNDVNMNNFEYKKFNSNNKYISFGNFIVQKPENNDTKESTDFEAFDYMCKTNKKYVPGVEFPCTYAELAEDVCNQCGLELGNNVFRNADKLVSENFFIDSEQCRVVLKEIAKIAFSWVRVATDNKVYFDFHKRDMQDADEIFTLDDYIELEPNDETIPINTIVLRNGAIESENITIKDDALIAEYGKQKELVVKEDYFAYSQEKRQELIEASRELMGLVYYPVNLKSIGTIYLESNDIIGVQNKKGGILNTYCFNHTIDFNGVLFDRIESPAMTEVETELQHESEEDLSKRRTEIIVNKAMQQIEATVKKDEIIARINMAIRGEYDEEISEEVEKSIIEIIANKISIKSDYFELTPEGKITATEGNIAGLIMQTNNAGDSWLYKNSTLADGTIIQNGLYIGKKSNGTNPFLYAGVDVTSGSDTLNNANTYITEEGRMFAKWFDVNGESGHFNINFNSGRKALQLTKNSLHWWLDNDSNSPFARIETINSGGSLAGIGTTLHDALQYGFYDSLHPYSDGSYRTILKIFRLDPNSSYWQKETAVADFFADILVSGTREDGVNHTIWISDGSEYWEVRTAKETSSDERLKTNIIDSTTSALDIINKIRHRSFDWKSDGKHVDIGYIAQELEKINPNFVNHNLVRDTYSINDFPILTIATKSIQELDEKCKKQQKAIEFLADKLGYTEEIKDLLT